MDNNRKIVSVLQELLSEYKKDSEKKWKTKALTTAIRSIKKYPHPITDGKESLKIEGVGLGISKRIDEILETNTLIELKQTDEFLDNVNRLIKITGVGDVRARQWAKIGIKNIADVTKSIDTGKISTTHHINVGIKYYDDLLHKIPRDEINYVEQILSSVLKTIEPKLIFEICGSYRRNKSTCGDVDVLITNPNIHRNIANKKYLTKIVYKLHNVGFLVDDLTTDGQKKYMGVYKLTKARRIDIRCFDYENFYGGVLYFTGSKDFNIRVRELALEKDMTLNEYGFTNKKTDEKIFLRSERELFDILGINYLSPSER